MANHTLKQKDRVRESTPPQVNQEIDAQLLDNLRQHGYGNQKAIKKRLQKLDQEWDMERLLEVNASSLALIGLILGTTKNKKWFILPGVVATFLLQHGLQGWCPPLPLFRKMGFRSREEIDQERNALKAIRGDYKEIQKTSPPGHVLEIVRSHI